MNCSQLTIEVLKEFNFAYLFKLRVIKIVLKFLNLYP